MDLNKERAELRRKEWQIYGEMREALVPMLSSPNERQRRAATTRLKRIDARMARLRPPVTEEAKETEESEDEGDSLIASLMAPAPAPTPARPRKRHLLYPS